jgi:hypothetical protein
LSRALHDSSSPSCNSCLLCRHDRPADVRNQHHCLLQVSKLPGLLTNVFRALC